MNVWSYCSSDWITATKAAGGVKPTASPPFDYTAVHNELVKAAEADVVYLNLHGFPGQPNLYGQSNNVIGPTALTPGNIKRLDWSKCVVFAEVCFSAADGGGVIAQAFLQSGARAFVGSTTEAYGRVKPTIFDGEADKLAYFFIKAYEKAGSPHKALDLAKRWLRVISYPLDVHDKATLESFVILTRKESDKND